MGCPFLICLAKEMQHIIFYAHVHACSPSYTVVPAILMRKKTFFLKNANESPVFHKHLNKILKDIQRY